MCVDNNPLMKLLWTLNSIGNRHLLHSIVLLTQILPRSSSAIDLSAHLLDASPAAAAAEEDEKDTQNT